MREVCTRLFTRIFLSNSNERSFHTKRFLRFTTSLMDVPTAFAELLVHVMLSIGLADSFHELFEFPVALGLFVPRGAQKHVRASATH